MPRVRLYSHVDTLKDSLTGLEDRYLCSKDQYVLAMKRRWNSAGYSDLKKLEAFNKRDVEPAGDLISNFYSGHMLQFGFPNELRDILITFASATEEKGIFQALVDATVAINKFVSALCAESIKQLDADQFRFRKFPSESYSKLFNKLCRITRSHLLNHCLVKAAKDQHKELLSRFANMVIPFSHDEDFRLDEAAVSRRLNDEKHFNCDFCQSIFSNGKIAQLELMGLFGGDSDADQSLKKRIVANLFVPDLTIDEDWDYTSILHLMRTFGWGNVKEAAAHLRGGHDNIGCNNRIKLLHAYAQQDSFVQYRRSDFFSSRHSSSEVTIARVCLAAGAFYENPSLQDQGSNFQAHIFHALKAYPKSEQAKRLLSCFASINPPSPSRLYASKRFLENIIEVYSSKEKARNIRVHTLDRSALLGRKQWWLDLLIFAGVIALGVIVATAATVVTHGATAIAVASIFKGVSGYGLLSSTISSSVWLATATATFSLAVAAISTFAIRCCRRLHQMTVRNLLPWSKSVTIQGSSKQTQLQAEKTSHSVPQAPNLATPSPKNYLKKGVTLKYLFEEAVKPENLILAVMVVMMMGQYECFDGDYCVRLVDAVSQGRAERTKDIKISYEMAARFFKNPESVVALSQNDKKVNNILQTVFVKSSIPSPQKLSSAISAAPTRL